MGIAPKELGIGGREDEAWTELALRFALSHPGVHCGIVGTTNPHNAEKNISYVEKGPLGAEVLEKLREAFEKGRDGEAWRGQT
jgi:aryl-alcohol dehydrogenase-like predicted oxidoreductase